ncbi:extensin family protein [Rhizobium sp. ARZ01]|uniref:extensin family protein n=1 Tax=Rhizobium sp. ARZ01 TaxID=2769313 RepID=UPI00177E84F1|nr:extensin family protein [Rhizobium sp. ARZ01]MBD9371674.1 extensin family protein [Rhizobium sp. ARZ01]
MALTRVESIAGLPLFYDRFNGTSYGQHAVAMRPFIDNNFLDQCTACFAEMQQVLAKHGFEITQIWSGGVGREGAGVSYHHRNRAFDLDALIFKDGSRWLADTFPARPFIYLAIEAVLRLHFGTVLNHDYNQAHRDHLHFDNGTAPRFKRDARSHTLFVQHALVKLFNQSVGADGVFGPETEQALNRVRRTLGIGSFSDKSNWFAFLQEVAGTALDYERSIVVAPDLVA